MSTFLFSKWFRSHLPFALPKLTKFLLQRTSYLACVYCCCSVMFYMATLVIIYSRSKVFVNTVGLEGLTSPQWFKTRESERVHSSGFNQARYRKVVTVLLKLNNIFWSYIFCACARLCGEFWVIYKLAIIKSSQNEKIDRKLQEWGFKSNILKVDVLRDLIVTPVRCFSILVLLTVRQKILGHSERLNRSQSLL